jgi:penicillin-binding protein 2
MGIGQDQISVTPLQMANSMCIVANKGYYYVPHFVEKVDGETSADTLLNKYKSKHEVLTHIPEDVYDVVISGMQDVTEIGTAKAVRIPGINMCAKTGTAENYLVIEHRRTKLKNNAMFVCFAPRENPTIAIAVVVQNAGYGAAWAAPIGSLLVEKYLNDTLRTESAKRAEQIANTNLLPKYLVRLQFVADSSRAAIRAMQRKDSTNYMKYINPTSRAIMLDTLGRYKNGIPVPPTNNPMLKPKNKIKIKQEDPSTR